MNDRNFFTILGWMRSKLGLKGNELLAYAIIYGFSQDGESSYMGTASYLADWIGASRQTIMTVLKNLIGEGLVSKSEHTINGVRYIEYKAVNPALQGVKNFDTPLSKNFTGGVKNFDTDNKYINNNISCKKENINTKGKKSDDSSIPQMFEAFWKSYPKKAAKKDALKAFIRIKDLESEFPAIMAGLEKSKSSDSWIKEGGKFVPYPSTWLNGERWNDEADPGVVGKFESSDAEWSAYMGGQR